MDLTLIPWWQGGQAVIHISIRHAYEHFISGRDNTVARLLEAGKGKVDVDVLSSSGSTALFYAINHSYIPEAITLLKAGANPARFGQPDRNPQAELDKSIQICKTVIGIIEAKNNSSLVQWLSNEQNCNNVLALAREEGIQDSTSTPASIAAHFYSTYHENFYSMQARLKMLSDFKEQMIELQTSELRKNARVVVGQVDRACDKSSAFFRLPRQLRVAIAAMTGGQMFDEHERWNAASKFGCKQRNAT